MDPVGYPFRVGPYSGFLPVTQPVFPQSYLQHASMPIVGASQPLALPKGLPLVAAKPDTSPSPVCPKCHSAIPWQNARESLKTTFFYCWLIRLSRKGGRNLVGDTLDALIPIPASWNKAIRQRLHPKIAYYRDESWNYLDLYRRFSKGKTFSPAEYFQKTIINTRMDGTLRKFYERQFFSGLVRLGLIGITWFDVGKYAYRAYQYPEERDKNLKKCLIQALKWTIGTEIGNLGGDLGYYFSLNPRYKMLSSFLMDALWSAMFDIALQKYMKD